MTTPREIPLPNVPECEGWSAVHRDDGHASEPHVMVSRLGRACPVYDATPTAALLAICADRADADIMQLLRMARTGLAMTLYKNTSASDLLWEVRDSVTAAISALEADQPNAQEDD